jgi:hypothetical protein
MQQAERNEHRERAEHQVSRQIEDENREPRKALESQHHNVSDIRTDKSRHRQHSGSRSSQCDTQRSVKQSTNEQQQPEQGERQSKASARAAVKTGKKKTESRQRNGGSANRARETQSTKRRAVAAIKADVGNQQRKQEQRSELATQAGEVSEKWSERRGGEEQFQSSTVRRKTLQHAKLRSGKDTRAAVQMQDSSSVRSQAGNTDDPSRDPLFKAWVG